MSSLEWITFKLESIDILCHRVYCVVESIQDYDHSMTEGTIMGEQQVVPIHLTILNWQEAMLRQYVKDEGMMGMSEALRRILTEWRTLRQVYPEISRTSDQESVA